MTAVELITNLVRGIFLILAAATLFDYLRRPNAVRLEIALLFGSFAPSLLLTELNRILPNPPPWLSMIATLGILAQPYVLLRLVHRMRPVARWLRGLALAGMLGSWAVIAVAAGGLPSAATLAVIVYFGGVEVYCAAALIRGARERGGVARRRMALAAAGSAWLAAVILLAGVSAVVPSIRPAIGPASQVLSLLASVTYFLGFTPPRFLRRSWQLSELYNFTRASSGAGSSDRLGRVIEVLCPAALKAVGGIASGVWMLEGESGLHQRAGQGADWPEGLKSQIEEPLLSIAYGGTPRMWKVPSPVEGGAAWIEAVALRDPVKTWGVVAVALRSVSLFPEDDLEVLGLLAERSTEALTSADLIVRQADLVKRLEKAMGEREAAFRELEAFSYSVSHDLRAPLRAIHGFSQLLLDEHGQQMTPEARSYLERVNSGGRQMGELIDDLLAFARLGRQALQARPVEPESLVRDVFEKLRAEVPDRRMDLVVGDLPACQGDPAMLRSVWTNLLSNAVKFTRTRQLARIEVGSRAEAEGPVYFVRDNGVGFSMEYADKLFGVFQRLHRAEDFEGTGVGLAIVQRVVQRHGGRLWAEAKVDEGATFYFSLGGANGAH